MNITKYPLALPSGLVVDGEVDTHRADEFEAALRETVADLLARADVEDLDAAAVRLAEELASGAGRRVEDVDPHRFERWASMAGRLAAAGASGTEQGVRRVLRSYGGKPQQVLAALAAYPEDVGVPQARLREGLGIEESYLSKIVARLADVDLVSRWRDGRQNMLRATAAARRFVAPSREPDTVEKPPADVVGGAEPSHRAAGEIVGELVPVATADRAVPMMPMDAYHDAGMLVLEFDLAGVEASDVEITVEDRVLTVTATRVVAEWPDAEWLVRERPHGTFRRQLALGPSVDIDAITARFDEGILTVAAPTTDESGARRVAVHVGEERADSVLGWVRA